MRIVRNLFDISNGPDLPEAAFKSNSTTSVLLDGFRSIVSTESLFRCFWQWTVNDCIAGKRYAFRLEMRNFSASLGSDAQFYIAGGTGAFSAVSGLRTYAETGGVLGMVVDCTVSGSITIRFGVGVAGGVGTHPWSGEIGNPCFSEIPPGQISPSEYMYPGFSGQMKYAYSNTIINGYVIDNTGVIDSTVDSSKSICVFGDSFANDAGDWPQLLQMTNIGKLCVYQNGVSGRSMIEAVSAVPSQITLSALNYSGVTVYPIFPEYVVRPSFAIIALGINDNNNALTDLTTLQNTVYAMVEQLVILGVQQIIFFDIPPWSGNSSWTAGKEAVRVLYNQWIIDYCQSNTSLLRCFKISRILGVAPDYSQLITAFDSGDHLHPNATGSIAIASALQNYLDAPFGLWKLSRVDQQGPAQLRQFAEVTAGTVTFYHPSIVGSEIIESSGGDAPVSVIAGGVVIGAGKAWSIRDSAGHHWSHCAALSPTSVVFWDVSGLGDHLIAEDLAEAVVTALCSTSRDLAVGTAWLDRGFTVADGNQYLHPVSGGLIPDDVAIPKLESGSGCCAFVVGG